VFCVCFNKFVDHDCRWGDTAHALARWRHPVAPSEATPLMMDAVSATIFDGGRAIRRKHK